MHLSVFCYMLGLAELLVGIPLLVSPTKTAYWINELKQADMVMRLIGGLFLLASILVLSTGVSIGRDVAGLVRLCAWGVAIKSLTICWWPSWHHNLMQRMLSIPWLQSVMGLVAIVCGVLFLLVGILV